MNTNTRIWVIPLIELALPCLVSLTLLISGQPINFPLSRAGQAFEIFPKLVSEHYIINEVYSLETAIDYTLTYANTFILGAFVALSGAIVTIIHEIATRRNKERKPLCDPDSEKTQNSNRSQAIRSLIGVASFSLALIWFSFYVPIAFIPSTGVSESRLINSLYGAFIFAFPVLFTLIYFLIIAGVNLLFSQTTSTAEH